jgi:hypothetical protein
MRWLKLTSWLLVLAALLVCLWYFLIPVGKYLHGVTLIEKLAYELRPAPYPNSLLVRSYDGGGDATMTATQIYHTMDPVDVVLEYYNNEMPAPPEQRDWYGHAAFIYAEKNVSVRAVNAACNSARYDPCEEQTPSVQIIIYANEELEDGSVIEVNISWHSP